MTEPISELEYIRREGVCCPVCQSTNIEGGGHYVEDGCYQEVTCLDCDATWEDRYTLSGYLNLVRGTR